MVLLSNTGAASHIIYGHVSTLAFKKKTISFLSRDGFIESSDLWILPNTLVFDGSKKKSLHCVFEYGEFHFYDRIFFL